MSSATPVPPTKDKLNVLSFAGKNKILHLGWMAFFLTFFVWFNHAPFLSAIGETLDLTKQQVKTLLILNVALTIPARVIIGMLTDKFGPRIVYTCILALGVIPCFTFAFAQDYTTLALSRFILGFVGAGFVVGIRLISDWFPASELGAAEGIYGGWVTSVQQQQPCYYQHWRLALRLGLVVMKAGAMLVRLQASLWVYTVFYFTNSYATHLRAQLILNLRSLVRWG